VLPFLTALAMGVVTVVVASALGVLSGSPSSFEDNDGNMIASGTSDWNGVTSLPGYSHVQDQSNSNSDDSFTPGTKQDVTCPPESGHKNSPKDDFTDVATFVETQSASPFNTFLYGATIRFTANGNASENIELNQGTAGTCSDGVTFARVAGDKLLAIDYVSPGAKCPFDASFSGPACFAVGTWVTAPAATCFVKTDTTPCWGDNFTEIGGVAFAEGAINDGLSGHTGAILAADNGISGVDVPLNQFAEFGVNLTAAGILPAAGSGGACETFAATTFESRASGSSFVSTTKDIARIKKPISNCGRITIIKRTDPRGVSNDFTFTSDIAGGSTPLANGSDGPCREAVSGYPGHYTLNDSAGSDGSANTNDCINVPSGTYHIAESDPGSAFSFENFSCTSSDSGTKAVPSSSTTQRNVAITIVGSATSRVTCVYTNKPNLGALRITKKSTKSGNPSLNGGVFSVTGPNGAVSGSPFTVNGSLCLDGLTPGSYTVKEVTPPAGYKINGPDTQTASVSGNNAKCSDATFAGTAFDFLDTPLTDLSITVTSEAPGGTSSTIRCTTGAHSAFPGTDIGNSPQGPSGTVTVNANGTTTPSTALEPGTYTCEVVVDP
jgi:hypothetical protein